MLKRIKVVEVAGIMTATEDDVATGWIITERTQHFYRHISSYPSVDLFNHTFNLVVGSFFALTNVDNTK